MSRDLGHIFKTIRADENDFWDRFAAELIEPENPENRAEKRTYGPRLPFSVRLNPATSQYEVIETAYQYDEHGEKIRRTPSLYAKDQKLSTTKHQSVSFSNTKEGYTPPFFGWNRSNREGLLVGVSFKPTDCLIWKIMVYDGGTVDRPSDFFTREEAETYLKKMISKGIYQTSLDGLEAEGKRNPDKYNEILAGLKWNLDGSSQLTIFSDNLESRLLALLRSIDLRNRLEKKYPDKIPIIVPISIYPNFELYTHEMQMRDIQEAEQKKEFSHYINALCFTTGKGINLNGHADIKSTYNLLKKLNVDCAKDFISVIMHNLKTNPKALNNPELLLFYAHISKEINDPTFRSFILDKVKSIPQQNWISFFVLESKSFDDFDVFLELSKEKECINVQKTLAAMLIKLREKKVEIDLPNNLNFARDPVRHISIASILFEKYNKNNSHPEKNINIQEKIITALTAILKSQEEMRSEILNSLSNLISFIGDSSIYGAQGGFGLYGNEKMDEAVIAAIDDKSDDASILKLFKIVIQKLSFNAGEYVSSRPGFSSRVLGKILQVVNSDKLPDILEMLDADLRKKFIGELTSEENELLVFPYINNFNTLKTNLILKIIIYLDSENISPKGSKNPAGFLSRFSLKDKNILNHKIEDAKLLIEKIINCTDIESLKIELQKRVAKNIELQPKKAFTKSDYTKCLETCFLKVKDYEKRFPTAGEDTSEAPRE